MCCGVANGLAGEIKVGLRGVTGGESGPVVVDVVLECVSPSDAPLRLGGASFSLVERDIVWIRRVKTRRLEIIRVLDSSEPVNLDT